MARCKVTARFQGLVHYVSENMAVASRCNRLYLSHDGGDSWQHFCTLPLPLALRARASSRLTRRLFRAMVHHVVRYEERRLVIVAYGRIYRYDLQRKALLPEQAPVCGSRPLALCQADASRLYYGEYLGNPDRRPVHVLGSDDGGRYWQPVYTFSGIRHVHGVFYDPYTNAVWVTTGDTDAEVGLWMTPDHFRSLHHILAGSQQVRIVQPLFTSRYVYFGTDTPLEVNYLYRWERATGRIEPLQQVEGSVFYGCKVGTRLFFATVCEPSRVNRSRDVVLWGSTDGETWKTYLNLRKDLWPKRLFQYGQILFPNGPGTPSSLWVTPLATRHDQLSLRLDLA